MEWINIALILGILSQATCILLLLRNNKKLLEMNQKLLQAINKYFE